MKSIPLCVVLPLLLLIACSDDTPTGPITNIKYSEHIQPILDEYEDILTTAGVFPEGLQMDSWANLIRGWERGEVVIPFDSENSLLIELTTKLDYDNKLGADDLALLERWIDEGARNDAGAVPYENSTHLLFVCSQDDAKISVIDTEAMVVIRNIDLTDLGYPIASAPHHIAVEPDGSAWYVSLIRESKVLKFNSDYEFVSEVSIEDPALLAAHPTNGLLYVSRFPQAADPIPERIGVIERSGNMTVLPEIPVRPTPHAMAVSHSGDFVYSCSLSESEVLVIDPTNNELTDIVGLGSSKGPLQLAVSPDDQTLYVSAQISNEMYVIDVSDPNNRQIASTIPVGAMPWHPSVSPDGRRVYVGNLGANAVSIINTATNQVVNSIGSGTGADGISQPHGTAVSGDGDFLFVACRNANGNYEPRFDFGDNDLIGTVVVINTATSTIHKVIEIEEFGSGVTIWEQ